MLKVKTKFDFQQLQHWKWKSVKWKSSGFKGPIYKRTRWTCYKINLLRKKDDLNCLTRLKTVGRWILTWIEIVRRWIQTFPDNILSENAVPTVVKGANLKDPYLKELLQVQDKRICLSQDESLANLQQSIFLVYGPFVSGQPLRMKRKVAPQKNKWWLPII